METEAGERSILKIIDVNGDLVRKLKNYELFTYRKFSKKLKNFEEN